MSRDRARARARPDEVRTGRRRDAAPGRGKARSLGPLGAALLMGAGCTSSSSPEAPAPAAAAPAAAAPAAALAERDDADDDGIADALDACPGSRTRVAVDARGCSVLDGAIAGIVFGPGRAGLGSAARAALEPVAAALLATPDVVVGIEGHTDNQGSAASNLELSKRRTLAVVRFLVTRGVGAGRLRPEAFGEARPVAPNATSEGREANRRIEVHVISAGSGGGPEARRGASPDGRRDAGAA